MKAITKYVLAAVIAMTVTAIVAGFIGFRWYSDNRRPNFKADIHLYVPVSYTHLTLPTKA